MKNTLITTTTVSVFLAFPVGFVLSKAFDGIGFLPMTAISAVVIFVITFAAAYLLNKSNTERLKKAEAEISDNILFKAEGYVQNGLKGNNAHIYISDDKIILISLDKKPYKYVAILKDCIKDIFFNSGIWVDIYTTDGECFKITINYAAGFKDFLDSHGWTK